MNMVYLGSDAEIKLVHCVYKQLVFTFYPFGLISSIIHLIFLFLILFGGKKGKKRMEGPMESKKITKQKKNVD